MILSVTYAALTGAALSVAARRGGPDCWPRRLIDGLCAAGGRVAGPAAEALLGNRLDDATVDWLNTNFLKTELELGHCLRLPQEGPCECDLFLRCSKFFTTSEYAPRLRARLVCEQRLIDDALERGWPREIERHTAISRRLGELLADLGEPTDHALQPSSTG
jgi:hypothetical protein